MRQYALTQEQLDRWQGITILRKMAGDSYVIPTSLNGPDYLLRHPVQWLASRGWIDHGRQPVKWIYTSTPSGREHLTMFEQRYYEYLRMFDIYHAVDTATGKFAFSYRPFCTPKQWEALLGQERPGEPGQRRWIDLRPAVAAYKGMDPLEIVFMSFLNEGRFDNQLLGWQFALSSNELWDEIAQICNSVFYQEDLEQAGISLDAVITEGSKLVLERMQIEEEIRALGVPASPPLVDPAQATETYRTVTETTIVTEKVVYVPVTEYVVYVDNPIYVPPIFVNPWW